MKKVMVFGTFDILHPGHLSLFRQAKQHGDHLTVVVARDRNVEKTKGRMPYHDEHKRLAKIKSLNLLNKVILGNLDDKYKVILENKPDVICIGYDQQHDLGKFKEELAQHNLSPKIERLKDYRKDIYKSSKLRPD